MHISSLPPGTRFTYGELSRDKVGVDKGKPEGGGGGRGGGRGARGEGRRARGENREARGEERGAKEAEEFEP